MQSTPPEGRAHLAPSLVSLSFCVPFAVIIFVPHSLSLAGDRCVFLAPSGCSFAPMTEN